MTTIIGISGSLRARSLNTALLDAAARLAPATVTIDIESIADVPLYNGDIEERDGIPAAVGRIKEKLAMADGLLLVSPEYNNSIPGVLKNAIDWLTRPADDIARVFHGRAVAVIGATPGPFGTQLAQNAWLPVVRTLRMRPWFEGRLMVSRAHAAFDASGALVDDKIRGQLATFMQGFARFVTTQRLAKQSGEL